MSLFRRLWHAIVDPLMLARDEPDHDAVSCDWCQRECDEADARMPVEGQYICPTCMADQRCAGCRLGEGDGELYYVASDKKWFHHVGCRAHWLVEQDEADQTHEHIRRKLEEGL